MKMPVPLHLYYYKSLFLILGPDGIQDYSGSGKGKQFVVFK